MLARKSSAMSGRPEKSPTAEAGASAPPRPSALPQVGAVAPKAPHGPWRPKSTGPSSSTSRAPNRGQISIVFISTVLKQWLFGRGKG